MSAGSAATTKRGPPRTDMDSRLRGNDEGEAVPAGASGTASPSPSSSPIKGEGFSLSLGCAEGQSPFAEGSVVDSPQDEGCPHVSNSLESPFGKVGPAAREVQQNAAGVRGVPEILFFVHPPRVGARGLNQARAITVQPEAAGSLRVSLRSLLYFPQEWGLGG